MPRRTHYKHGIEIVVSVYGDWVRITREDRRRTTEYHRVGWDSTQRVMRLIAGPGWHLNKKPKYTEAYKTLLVGGFVTFNSTY